MRLIQAVIDSRTGRYPCALVRGIVCAIPLVAISALGLHAQTAAPEASSAPAAAREGSSTDLSIEPLPLKSLPKNILTDQKKFWTTPFRMSQSQWQWTVPLALIGTSLLASDTAIQKHISPSPTTASRAVSVSNAGVAAMVGVGAGMYLWGRKTHNDPPRETGLLAGEAAIDVFLDTEVLKYAFGRQRPLTGDGRGLFFQGGTSFPSQHAAVGWAIASVIAHEYPGPLTQILVYGAAGGISAARMIGQQHFATDVIVGSALGWYMGRQVFRSHSRYSAAEIAKWGTFTRGEEDTAHEPGNMGSPFVSLDSWVYPAMERLIARGYIRSAYLGMRPWTRMECARLLAQEAGGSLQDEFEPDDYARIIYENLKLEFADEIARLHGESNLGLAIDSIYSRVTGISGLPLQDGLHFGQTLVNDYGRPYAEGFNNVTGIAGHGQAGPLSFYVRAEYQHAPSIPALSAAAAQTIQAVDGLPSAPPMISTPAVNRVSLLEGYVGMQLNNWQFSFGKQAVWWGPDASGPTLFSRNAPPILMFQINRVTPFKIPILGSVRLDFLVGRLSGQHWVFGVNTGFVGGWTQTLSNQPFIVGQKISLKPTENLELSFSTTALFAGPGVPAIAHNLVRAMFSTGNGVPGSSGDAGDRRGAFDVSYRFPQLAGLTLYADAFTDDEPTPWLAWNKAALVSGFHLAQFPGIPKLDLRMEGLYSDPPGSNPTVRHGFFYSNSRYKSGYTNDGYLIGSWIGRQGQGAQGWATYWLSPRNNVQLNFRHQKVSQQFIPDGGSLTDIGISADYWIRNKFGVSARVQHERWLFPVLQPNPSRNLTVEVQVLFEPKKLFPRPQ